jgi:hypothetical protein
MSGCGAHVTRTDDSDFITHEFPFQTSSLKRCLVETMLAAFTR